MLPPVESWGRMYAAVPFAIVSETAVNKVRLVAAEDNTDIQIHDTSRVITRTLARAGDWIEVDLWLPTLYTSSKPFLAAQFMPSRQFRTSVPYSANGDPSMVVLPAVDQYVGSTMFRFPELLPQSMLTTQDFLYYVTVIAEEAAVHTLRVNGVLASQLDPMMYWQTIPGTTMHWTNLQLPLGTYTISCDSGSFGGIMYGLSQADSYANIFGATYDRSQRHTQTPPKYNLVVDCGKIDGTIVDLPQDSGKVVDVLVQTSRCINYSWEVQGPLDASGTTDVHAWVKDLWKDARFVIHAYDSSGAGREWLYEYFAPSLKTPVRVQIDPASTGSPCTLIPIVNTGTKPLHIHGTVLAGDERLHTVPSVIPDTTIEPADTLWVQVCFTSNGKLGPAQARMVVQLDCGLQKDIVVECLNNVQFTTNDLDFGDVRIGDTACAKVPVVNTGTSTITITAILLSAILEPFHLDTQSIALPVELMPADTLWLDVCFTPQAETTYVRTDTVSSAEAGSLWTTYRGRGVRPHVPPVVVDWGKQRVGKPTDMTFTIANTGTARCVVDTTLIARQVKEFMVTNAPFPQQLLPGSTMQGQARFAPSAVQSYADTLHLSVDWPLHERTWVAFIGEGTMPDVRVFDVDMGKVVVGSTKDSTPIVLSADGNEPLTIGGEQHSGVDLAAFSFSTALPVNTQIAQGTSIALPIAFRPSRVGMHEMFIRVLSDAAPFGETDTAIIRIIGEGVPEPVQQLDAELLATTTLPACVLDSGRIVLRNTGNIPVTVDSIHVMIDADPALISTVLPLTIAPSDNLVLGFALLLPKGSPVNITVDVWYSGEHKILTQSIDVVPATPSVAIQAPAMVTAGERLAVPFSVSQQGTLDATQQVTITLATSALQFRLSQTPVVVNVSDITGSWQETITPIVNDANLTLSVGKPVLAPFTITGTIDGTALLSKDGAVVVRAIMSETQCADEATAVAISTMDACGGALRLVRVGAMPQVVAQLKTSPATNVLKLSVHASQKATLSVALLSLEGTEFVLCRNLQLEKGIQDCIFSINSVASGFYGLILRDGSGAGTTCYHRQLVRSRVNT